MSAGSSSSLTPPEWVAKQATDKAPDVVATPPAAAAAPTPVKEEEDKGFALPSLKGLSKNEHWLDTHHNPDSPIHTPPHSPDREPTGIEKNERPDHWVHFYRKKHGFDVGEEEHENSNVEANYHKRGWLKGTFHELGTHRKYMDTKKARQLLALLVVIVLLGTWGTSLWLVKERKAAPNGDIFALLCMWVFSFCLGEAVRGFTHPLLGSIVAGFILRFIPGIRPHKAINSKTQGHVRSMALIVILTRAGMSLDLVTLGKLPVLCGLMPTIPLISEAAIVAFLTHHFFSFTWKWGFMAGFLVSAVSPAVVVPVLLSLAGEGYGLEKGIPSLVLAVAALCDVFSIAGFSVWETITFKKISIVEACFRAPEELVIGIVAGLALGALAVVISPRGKNITGHESKDEIAAARKAGTIDDRAKGYTRTALTLGFGFFTYFGFHHLEYNGSGAMGVFVLGSAVALGWGRARTARVQSNLAHIWIYLAQPLLFAMIGINIDPKLFYKDLSFLWQAIVILLIAMFGRMAITFVAAFASNLNHKEKLFLAFAWIPKATVQAALGAAALLAVKSKYPVGDPLRAKYVEWGTHILNLSILSILMTAPVGATIMAIVGPRLLTKNELPKGGVHLAAH